MTDTKEAAEALLLKVRGERSAYKFEVKKTPAEIAAEVNLDEFDPATRFHLMALMKAGDFIGFAAAVGQARLAAAEQRDQEK